MTHIVVVVLLLSLECLAQSENVTCIALDKDGTLHVGTTSGYVWKYGGSPFQWTKLLPNPIDPKGLGALFFNNLNNPVAVNQQWYNDTVYEVVSEKVQLLAVFDAGGWVQSGGAIYHHQLHFQPELYSIYELSFSPFSSKQITNSWRPSQPVYFSYARIKDTLYYAAYYDGYYPLYQYDELSGNSSTIALKPPSSSRSYEFSVGVDGTGVLYGSVMGMVYRYEGDGKWQLVYYSGVMLKLKNVNGVLYGDDGETIWKFEGGTFNAVNGYPFPGSRMAYWVMSDAGVVYGLDADGLLSVWDEASKIWVKIW